MSCWRNIIPYYLTEALEGVKDCFENVIPSPSLHVILSEAKNLLVSLRTGSARNLYLKEIASELKLLAMTDKEGSGFYNGLIYTLQILFKLSTFCYPDDIRSYGHIALSIEFDLPEGSYEFEIV